MRSKGTFSVQAICREHFGGGGHRNASGGYSKSSLEDTLKKLKEVFPSYLVTEKIENS
jgi:phosphoesterase RecJ-like protein